MAKQELSKGTLRSLNKIFKIMDSAEISLAKFRDGRGNKRSVSASAKLLGSAVAASMKLAEKLSKDA